MPYDIDEHRHRFAVWAAARAAQRACTAFSTANCQRVLDAKRNEFDQYFTAEKPGEPGFDRKHGEWVAELQRELGVSFGRAAKLLNVYFKVTVVLGDERFARWRDYVHPPIDERILRFVARNDAIDADERVWLRGAKWTSFDEPNYRRALKQLRRVAKGWRIESGWHAGDADEAQPI